MDKKCKVIFADDTTQFGKECVKVLEEHGIDVILTSKNGVDAFSALVSQKADGIIMDLFMPGLDAMAVLDKIKSEKRKILRKDY